MEKFNGFEYRQLCNLNTHKKKYSDESCNMNTFMIKNTDDSAIDGKMLEIFGL